MISQGKNKSLVENIISCESSFGGMDSVLVSASKLRDDSGYSTVQLRLTVSNDLLSFQ